MGRGGDLLGASLGEAVVDSRGFAARHKPAKTTAKPRLVGCPKGPCSTTKRPALKRKIGRVLPARIWRMAKYPSLKVSANRQIKKARPRIGPLSRSMRDHSFSARRKEASPVRKLA